MQVTNKNPEWRYRMLMETFFSAYNLKKNAERWISWHAELDEPADWLFALQFIFLRADDGKNYMRNTILTFVERQVRFCPYVDKQQQKTLFFAPKNAVVLHTKNASLNLT